MATQFVLPECHTKVVLAQSPRSSRQDSLPVELLFLAPASLRSMLKQEIRCGSTVWQLETGDKDGSAEPYGVKATPKVDFRVAIQQRASALGVVFTQLHHEMTAQE